MQEHKRTAGTQGTCLKLLINIPGNQQKKKKKSLPTDPSLGGGGGGGGGGDHVTKKLNIYIFGPIQLGPIGQSVCKAKKKVLFVSRNGLKKRVGRSGKYFFCTIFLVKNVCFMHVLR